MMQGLRVQLLCRAQAEFGISRRWPVILLGWRADRYSRTPAARRMSPNWRTSSSSRVRAGWRTDASRLLQHSRCVAGTNRSTSEMTTQTGELRSLPTPPPRPVEWPPERSRNMTARIAAAWPRCSGSRWVTPLPTTLRKVPRRAGDQYAAEARASADVVLSKVARPS